MKYSCFVNKLYVLLGVLFITPNFAFAKSAIHPELKIIAAKFSIAMIGVVLFSLLLYIGLSLYNRFFVSDNIKNESVRNNSLASPRDKQEAIMSFIYRNRLK